MNLLLISIVNYNPITNFAAFFIGVALFRNFSKEIKTVFYFVTLGVITEISARLFMHYVVKNAMPIGHFYFPVAFFLIGVFYIQVLKNFIRAKYIIAVIIAFEIYCVINTLFIQGLFEFASLVGSIGSIIVSIFSVAFYTKIMLEAKIVRLSKEPVVWINTAFLIYFTGNFFYYSLYNLRLIASMEIALIALEFFSALNILFYLAISIAFIKAGIKKSQKIK